MIMGETKIASKIKGIAIYRLVKIDGKNIIQTQTVKLHISHQIHNNPSPPPPQQLQKSRISFIQSFL
jgi:hypothetical protein